MSGRRPALFLPERPKSRPRMEFALPTINVIFLLMLYFLSAGTLAGRSELDVAPPQTMQVPAELLPRPLLLVTTDGRLMLDGDEIGEAELGEAGLAAIEAAQAVDLNLLVPRAMAATLFVDLLARLEAAGVPVRLITVERRVEGTSP